MDSPQAADRSAPSGPSGVEEAKPVGLSESDESLENFMLSPRHLKLTQVVLMDQSDVRNELVQEHEWLLLNERNLELRGNLFVVEDNIRDEGLVFVKFAPLPDARPIPSSYDCQVSAAQRRVRFAGQGYPYAVLAYSGGHAGMTTALHAFQRQLRRYEPTRDGMLLSNT